jgi:flagellar motor switch protein FliM
VSEADPARAVLSREELEAILAGVEERRRVDQEAERGSAAFRPHAVAPSPLTRRLEAFASEQGRAISALYQHTLRFALLRCEPATLRDLADLLLPSDRVAVTELRPGAPPALIAMGRSLLFAWLTLAFGSRPGTPVGGVPTRPYTRIEERFLRRAAAELARSLAAALDLSPPEPTAVMLLDPGALPGDPAAPHVVASFEVHGFRDVCRLRVVLPEALLRGGAAEAPRAAPPDAAFGASLLEMPVRVRVEAGVVELPLERVARLRVGDVLALEPAAHGEFLVHIEDQPRFRAVQGTVDRRVAVQITERLG